MSARAARRIETRLSESELDIDSCLFDLSWFSNDIRRHIRFLHCYITYSYQIQE